MFYTSVSLLALFRNFCTLLSKFGKLGALPAVVNFLADLVAF